MKNVFLIAIPLLFVSVSCHHPVSKNNNMPKAQIHLPDFNEDTAYFYTQAQFDFGPRVCNTQAHEKCASFLVARLKPYADVVKVQHANVKAFDGTILKSQNIIASFRPESSQRIMLCAHWDSRPFSDHDPNPANRKKPVDGANDGASGVGILMEVARQLSITKPGIGVDIIFFDAEDYGAPESALENSEDSWCLGSQYWAKNPHVQGYKARFGILLDMVGAEDATFYMEGISMYYAPDVTKKVWDIANSLGFSNYFSFTTSGSLTDDHLYINKIINIPTIDIIHQVAGSENGFFPYWHTTKDNMDNISRKTLKIVGQTLLAVIHQEGMPV